MGPAEDMERTTVPHRMYVSFNIRQYALDVHCILSSYNRNEIKFIQMENHTIVELKFCFYTFKQGRSFQLY